MKKLLIFLAFLCLACHPKHKAKDYPVWTEEDRELLIREFRSTKAALHALVDDLTDEQWHFKPDENSWSIAYIIEHLQLQEDMHYREVRIVSMQPPQPEFSLKTIGNDEKVNAYETLPEKGVAGWNVTPLGRWPTKAMALMAFDRSRDNMIALVKNMNADLRQQVTFRNIPDKDDFRNVRNLHQILLTTIAHTKRHMHQLKRIKAAGNFPQ